MHNFVQKIRREWLVELRLAIYDRKTSKQWIALSWYRVYASTVQNSELLLSVVSKSAVPNCDGV